MARLTPSAAPRVPTQRCEPACNGVGLSHHSRRGRIQRLRGGARQSRATIRRRPDASVFTSVMA